MILSTIDFIYKLIILTNKPFNPLTEFIENYNIYLLFNDNNIFEVKSDSINIKLC